MSTLIGECAGSDAGRRSRARILPISEAGSASVCVCPRTIDLGRSRDWFAASVSLPIFRITAAPESA